MGRMNTISSSMKGLIKCYHGLILSRLEARGFIDLRPSFLEILLYICENQGVTIKNIGLSCNLKKQTMTSHLNELEGRGYIKRLEGQKDKRTTEVFLTDYGARFKTNLLEVIEEVESTFNNLVGEVEMDRILLLLKNLEQRIHITPSVQ